jgi:hypothetical protein
MPIDRWFARRGPCCDLIDARALETSFKKDPLRGVKDAPFDIAGKILARPAEAAASFCFCTLRHKSILLLHRVMRKF